MGAHKGLGSDMVLPLCGAKATLKQSNCLQANGIAIGSAEPHAQVCLNPDSPWTLGSEPIHFICISYVEL